MDMLHVASAVNPCFKALPFLSEEEWDSTFSRLQTEAVSGMEEEASNVSNNKKPCGKIQANPTLFSLTHSLTHLCIQYKFSLTQQDDADDEVDGVEEEVEAQPPAPNPKQSSALESLLGEAYRPREEGGAQKTWAEAEDEIKRYRARRPAELRDEKQYPLLALMAKRYLCVPGTSVASERVFSTAGDIITAKRSCLTPGHVDELLFLQKNLKIP